MIIIVAAILPSCYLHPFHSASPFLKSAQASLSGNYSNKLVRQQPPATLIMPALVFWRRRDSNSPTLGVTAGPWCYRTLAKVLLIKPSNLAFKLLLLLFKLHDSPLHANRVRNDSAYYDCKRSKRYSQC